MEIICYKKKFKCQATRNTFLVSSLLTGMSSGVRVNSQANWLLIWIKASHHIKKNFWENTLMIWFCMLPALLWFSPLLLCFSLFIPVGLLMETQGSNTSNTPKRLRGRVENIRTMHQKHLLLLVVFKIMEELLNYSVSVDLHEKAPVISHNTLSVLAKRFSLTHTQYFLSFELSQKL